PEGVPCPAGPEWVSPRSSLLLTNLRPLGLPLLLSQLRPRPRPCSSGCPVGETTARCTNASPRRSPTVLRERWGVPAFAAPSMGLRGLPLDEAPAPRRLGPWRVLERADVEPDGEEVPHVEGALGDGGRDDVIEQLELQAIVLLLVALAGLEHVVDLLPGVHQ